ncbi:hypothetical protein NOV18_08760 [Pseudomonas asiatica]|uniref:Uncharacterized protein n=1 Tax=Pseudomonas asiatica TaxID=2219225 RepID=A0AAJ5IJU1_9PSED|nr:hypothetical protein [Pseudomonas asiatica]UUC20555.1 hypothetical protein NOV18_08760 [Pseudomonas asiatica]
MAFVHSTYSSGADYLSALAVSILPSNDWVAVKNSDGEIVFRLPHGQGYVAFIVAGNVCEIQAFQDYDPTVSTKLQAGGYSTAYSPFLPRVSVPAGPVEVWTVVSSRRVAAVIKSRDAWYSLYAGLLLPFGSNRAYSFPCFIGGSGQIGNSTYESAYPFFSGGDSYCPKVVLPNGAWQKVGGNAGGTSSFFSFPYSYPYSYIWPFDGKFQRLGSKLDGSAMLYSALVCSSGRVDAADALNADDGKWLGYLDGVYAVSQGRAAGSVIEVDGVDYLVVPNVSKISETYALRLS